MTASERAYYERRAAEFDDWYLGTGLFAARVRPGWHEEVEALRSLVRSLSSRSAVDVACGTAFLTQHLPGRVVSIDHSPAMLKIARTRLPEGALIQADAMCLPFDAGVFDYLIAGHFYGHLARPDRIRFVAEARRVAAHLLIIDAALQDNIVPDGLQERVLQDGSRHTVYKRYFTPAQLVSELGRGRVLHAGRWFVAVQA